MVFWIKRFATILGILTFFILLFANVDYSDPLNMESLIPALIKAFVGATLFWLAGFIVGDIIFKNIITDIDTVKEDLIEGGILQRVYDQKEMLVPGSKEMPFSISKKEELRLKRKKEAAQEKKQKSNENETKSSDKQLSKDKHQ